MLQMNAEIEILRTNNTMTNSNTKPAAQFESSFTGLDLSEFSSEPTSARQSASAQLMELKKKEALHKRQDEEEESLMHHKASMKAQNALKRLDDDREEKAEHNILHSALLSMHGNDLSGAKKAKNGGKTKAQRKTRTLAKNKTKTAKGIHKKSKRSKF